MNYCLNNPKNRMDRRERKRERFTEKARVRLARTEAGGGVVGSDQGSSRTEKIAEYGERMGKKARHDGAVAVD